MKSGYQTISEDDAYGQHSKNSRSNHLLYGLLTIFIVVVVVATLQFNASSLFSFETSKDSADANSFTFKRLGYDPLPYFSTDSSKVFTYQILKGHLGVIEPHADTIFHSYGLESSNVWSIRICPRSTSAHNCQDGTFRNYNHKEDSTVFNFGCDPYDVFDVYVEKRSSDGSMVQNVTGTLLCMPVRRELRNLLSADRQAYVDATFEIYSKSDKEGKALYGDNFKNSDYLLGWHHFSAAQQDADHLHGGNGFLMQHVKVTNIFEKALQAIVPSMAQPYWDFTIEHSEQHVFFDAFMINDEQFGSMSFPKSMEDGFSYKNDNIVDARIPDSKFKNLKVGMNKLYTEMKVGYGYMRAPWNLNPSPYVSRFTFDPQQMTLPGCSDHYEVLKYNDLMDFMFEISQSSHATTHALSGGIFGCDIFDVFVTEGLITDTDGTSGLCNAWPFFIKEIYRQNMGRPNDRCVVPDDDKMNEAFCQMYCISPDDVGDFLYKHVHHYTDPKVRKNDLRDFLIDFVCSDDEKKHRGNGTRLFVGDHLESASPADPSFWVIHPTLERLLQVKYMGGGFVHKKWATDPLNEFVCMRPSCFNATQGYWSNWTDCCLGHFPNDRIIDPEYNNRSLLVGSTNVETLAATDASSSSYSMPYIYDAMNWDHCQVDILAQATSMNTNMQLYRDLGGDELLSAIQQEDSLDEGSIENVRYLRADDTRYVDDKRRRWLEIVEKTNTGPTLRQKESFARKTRIRRASGRELDDEIPGFVAFREKVKRRRSAVDSNQ